MSAIMIFHLCFERNRCNGSGSRTNPIIQTRFAHAKIPPHRSRSAAKDSRIREISDGGETGCSIGGISIEEVHFTAHEKHDSLCCTIYGMTNAQERQTDVHVMEKRPESKINRRTLLIRSGFGLAITSLFGAGYNIVNYSGKLEKIRQKCEEAMNRPRPYDAPSPDVWLKNYTAFLNSVAKYRDWKKQGGLKFLLGGDLEAEWVTINGQQVFLGRCGSFAADFVIGAAACGGFDEVAMELAFLGKSPLSLKGHFYGMAGKDETLWALESTASGVFSVCKIPRSDIREYLSNYACIYECFRCVRKKEESPQPPIQLV